LDATTGSRPREDEPEFPTGTLMQIFIPSWAPGGFAGVQNTIQYVRWLGVSGLVSQPVGEYDRDSEDGPYGPRDPTKVDAEFGGEAGLVALNDQLWRAGITPIGDLVANHVHERSEIVQRALRDPQRWGAWLRTTDDPVRDRWDGKTNIFGLPTRYWVEELGRWRASTFKRSQVELNAEHPPYIEFIADLAATMTAEWGYGGLRLDAIGHVVANVMTVFMERRDGAVHNPADPAALALAGRIQRRLLALRNPDGRRPFTIAEAGGTHADIAAWLDVSDMAYDFVWLPTLLQCVDNSDWETLRSMWASEPRTKGTLLRYLGSHDERSFRYVTFGDELVARHGGQDGRYVCFDGTGVTRRVRDLLPNEHLMVMLVGLTVLADGTPLLYQGDPEGYGGDREANEWDVRDPNRCRHPLDADLPNAGWPPDARYPLEPTWRTRSVAQQFRNPNSVLRRSRQYVYLRRRFPAIQWGERVDIEGTKRVLAFARMGPRSSDHDVIVLANISGYEQTAELDLSRWRNRSFRRLDGNLAALMSADPAAAPHWRQMVSWGNHSKFRVDLAPHQLMVIEAY
jgi:glycosidase